MMAHVAHNRWKFAMKHAIALRCMQTALGWAAMLGLPLLTLPLLGGDMRAEMNLSPAGELTARDLHVWGRFGVGTWKQVRIVTESIGARGEVVDTTTTETKTTLVRADASRLTLRIEATVEVAGKRFQSQPQVVEYGYYGEAPNEPTDLKTIGTAQVTIGDRQCNCQVQQVVANVGAQKQITKLFVSDDFEPYILRRDTTVVTSDNKVDAKQQTTAEVVGLDRPYKVLHDVKPTAYERTIQHTPRGTNFTDDVTSPMCLAESWPARPKSWTRKATLSVAVL